MPRRARLLYGSLQPDATSAFLLLPDGGGEHVDGGGGAPPPDDKPDRGYPPDTPVDQMTEPQQTAYWRDIARKHEARAAKDLQWRKDNEAKVVEHDKLVAASRTEQEKALEAAKATALAEGRQVGAAGLVQQVIAAELRAASKGEISAESAAKRVAFLDKAMFLGADGQVDMAKVGEWVTEQVPAPAAGGEKKKLPVGFPDLGQGQRGNGAKPSGKEAGLAEAEKRFGKPAAQSA